MQASVGVAMGSGTDVATETANVVLLGNNLLEFVTALKIARRVHRVVVLQFCRHAARGRCRSVVGRLSDF